MQVSNIDVSTKDGACIYRAEVKSAALKKPFRLWYQFPSALQSFLEAENGDPLVAALLLPAMQMGEGLDLTVLVSPKLAKAVDQIQSIYRCWDPTLNHVDINTPLRATPLRQGDEIGLFFSSGVDSTYSLTKNVVGDPLNKDVVTRLLVVDGMEFPVNSKAQIFDQMISNTNKIAWRLDKEVVEIATNVKDLYALLGIPWGSHGHGAALASIALALQGVFRKIYTAPCGSSFLKLLPNGSHPLLDPLWSTESLTLIHHGCDATRLERIRFIAENPIALETLRVCWDRETEAFNCGHCSKCLLAMVGLELVGSLAGSKTFPCEIDLAALHDCVLNISSELEWCEELLDTARYTGARKELCVALEHCLTTSRTYLSRIDRVKKTLNALIPPDKAVVLLDGEAIRERLGAGRRILPFLERNGQHYGNPPDSRTAIHELERMRSDGVDYLAIWWCCAWQLNYYAEFGLHVRSNYNCVWEDESMSLYDLRLRQSVDEGGAYAVEGTGHAH